MEFESIVRSMRARMPWPVGQAVLNEAEIAKGRGWEATVAKLVENEKKLVGSAGLLQESLKEHILGGEKLSRFFELSDDEMERLASELRALRIPKSTYSDRYPGLLNEDELRFQKGGLVPVAIEVNGDGVALILASVRVVSVREEVDRAAMPEEASEALEDYDLVVGVRHVRQQAMDVIWVPHEGNLVDVRIDFPKGMHHDIGEAAHGKVYETLHKLLGYEPLKEPINLYPLIRHMYDDEKEGAVVEMSFSTTTGSIKQERMRARGLCLRKEHYHQGGKGALKDPIDPFRISISWKNKIGQDRYSHPELSLNSSARTAMGNDPVLLSAVIQKCVGLADYEHVRERVEHHLAAI